MVSNPATQSDSNAINIPLKQSAGLHPLDFTHRQARTMKSDGFHPVSAHKAMPQWKLQVETLFISSMKGRCAVPGTWTGWSTRPRAAKHRGPAVERVHLCLPVLIDVSAVTPLFCLPFIVLNPQLVVRLFYLAGWN